MDFLLNIYEVYDINKNICLIVNINVPPSVKLAKKIKQVIMYLSQMTYRKIQTTIINDRDGLNNEINWDRLYDILFSLEEIQIHRMIADDTIEDEIMKYLIQDVDLIRDLTLNSTIQDLVEHDTIKLSDAKKIIKYFNYLLNNEKGKKNRKEIDCIINSDDFMRVLCAYLFYTVAADKKKKNALIAKYYWKHGSAMLEVMNKLKEQYPVGHGILVRNYENSILYKNYDEMKKIKMKERKKK